MKYLFNLLYLFIIALPLNAQNIYFSKSHTEDGQPIDADLVWDIRPFGESIYILFDNGGKPINESILYMLVDKLDDDKYLPYDSKAIHIQKSDTWVAQDYKLKEPGEYEVYVMGASRERLATARMTVEIKNPNQYANNDRTSLYYDDSELVFCQVVVGGRPLNIRKTLSLSKDGSTYVYLKADRPINTDTLLVNVWRKSPGSFDYDEFVDSKKYRMKSDWNNVFFIYRFKGIGQYKFSVYNEKEILIKYSFITVGN